MTATGPWRLYQACAEPLEKTLGGPGDDSFLVVAARNRKEAEKTAAHIKQWFVSLYEGVVWTVPDDAAAKYSVAWPGEVSAAMLREFGSPVKESSDGMTGIYLLHEGPVPRHFSVGMKYEWPPRPVQPPLTIFGWIGLILMAPPLVVYALLKEGIKQYYRSEED